MRMDPEQDMDAATWLNEATAIDISRVLRYYGEEKHSRRIALAIVEARALAPITTTRQLSEIVSSVYPAHLSKKHPATRTFQAIRIYINRELDELKETLAMIPDVLAPGGRLSAISFHSLEDRLVKRFIQRESTAEMLAHDLPVRDLHANARMKKIGPLIRPTAEEIVQNVRSRSARLRIAERV